jgi:hypothetical protein
LTHGEVEMKNSKRKSDVKLNRQLNELKIRKEVFPPWEKGNTHFKNYSHEGQPILKFLHAGSSFISVTAFREELLLNLQVSSILQFR